MSYRMSKIDKEYAKSLYYGEPSYWIELRIQADNLKNGFFLVTGSGSFFQNVEREFEKSYRIIEINDTSKNFLETAGRQQAKSEIPTDLMSNTIRFDASDSQERVIYHTHVPEIIALTTIVPPEAKTLTKIL